MSNVQLQRLRVDGSAAELLNVEISTPTEYRELIEPMDRRAREDGGYTLTVAEGAPRYRRSILPEFEGEL